MLHLRGPVVGQPVGEGGAVGVTVEADVEGAGGPFEPVAAEVIDQQIAGEGGQPGLEAALLEVEAGEVLVELEEDLLGQVFGIAVRAGEPVADGIDSAVLGDNQLLPGLGVAGEAFPD